MIDKNIIKMIPCVDAMYMPKNVLEYCVEVEISTHYQHDIAFIEDDGNPLSEWLKEIGFVFEKEYETIGIIAT